ncbi:MAG: LysR substrate-binding domain-containing protein [Gammaproteobacteria bacterium]|nr:LysR substrate-binding domain-containing protein [Gammaproteobacteria bacterium]
MRISAKQLAVFVAIAKQGNLTRAAESLHMSQAAASMSLADLENQLDASLFDRVGKKLMLNSIGQALLPKAVDIVSKIQEFEVAAKNPVGLSGELIIGASTTIANYVLPKIISSFIERYPQIKISLQVGNTEQIIGQMGHFQLDLGFIEGTCHSPELNVELWQQDELVCFTRPGHLLARQEAVSIDDLSSAQWIMREQGSGTREIFERSSFDKLARLNIMLELGSAEAIKQAVMGSDAIGCLSALTLQAELANHSLVKLPVPELVMKRDLLILTHGAKSESSLVQAFRSSMVAKADKPRIKLRPIVS